MIDRSSRSASCPPEPAHGRGIESTVIVRLLDHLGEPSRALGMAPIYAMPHRSSAKVGARLFIAV